MRGKRNLLFALSFALSMTLLGPIVARAEAQGPASVGPDPQDTVRAELAALDSGDADGAVAMFADTAIRIRPAATGSCAQQSPCRSPDENLAGFQFQVFLGECQTIIDLSTNGSIVTGRYEARNNPLRGRGVERILVALVAQVVDGKIAAQFALPDLEDPPTAFILTTPATQLLGPPVPKPATCG